MTYREFEEEILNHSFHGGDTPFFINEYIITSRAWHPRYGLLIDVDGIGERIKAENFFDEFLS